MGEEQDKGTFKMDEDVMFELLAQANNIQRGKKNIIEISGSKWRIRPISQRQSVKMLNYDFDIRHWQQELKKSNSVEELKRLNIKIRKAYAKKAAHLVLGRRLWLLPTLFWLTWQRIYNSPEQVSATINTKESLGTNKDFYLANLLSSRQALAHSMEQVGETVEQRMKRGESAESMVEQDGLPKKEDSKSAARSNAPRTTKR